MEKTSTGPVVVDLGRKSQKNIKKLRKGDGPLAVSAMNTFEALKKEGRLPEGAVPVLVIVRERNPWKKWSKGWNPFK